MEPDRERPEVEGPPPFHPRRHAPSARKRSREAGDPALPAGGQVGIPGQGAGPRRPRRAAALARPYLRSRDSRAEDRDNRQAKAGRRTASRCDDVPGAAAGFRRPPQGIRRAEDASAQPGRRLGHGHYGGFARRRRLWQDDARQSARPRSRNPGRLFRRNPLGRTRREGPCRTSSPCFPASRRNSKRSTRPQRSSPKRSATA